MRYLFDLRGWLIFLGIRGSCKVGSQTAAYSRRCCCISARWCHRVQAPWRQTWPPSRNILEQYAFLFLRVHFGLTATGRYFESYFVILASEEDRLVVFKHTLPYFVPVAKLAAEKLSSNFRVRDTALHFLCDFCDCLSGSVSCSFVTRLQEFARALGDYLNGYVGRREQLREFAAARASDSTTTVSTSPAFDFIDIHTTAQSRCARKLSLLR